MAKLDWEKAARRDSARPAPPIPSTVVWWLTINERAPGMRCDECRIIISVRDDAPPVRVSQASAQGDGAGE